MLLFYLPFKHVIIKRKRQIFIKKTDYYKHMLKESAFCPKN
ncbi:hypothetical protein HMPREF9320_1279 [Streptococcus pseudoporcinus SPIN 20026]|nr:hypothetical protein HMPREF9320_1279 [Streptococcus pseudoporcinus SPIN 20026]